MEHSRADGKKCNTKNSLRCNCKFVKFGYPKDKTKIMSLPPLFF
ncbi:hypothetical protein D3OALGA1CA_5524 [Olavius algarvensis associated proteobacterium Delta 3]|nr:hypothetical protein D3OALGA1CA_5524 [Olavius algarvensis associated proteobacterium Delta 3]